MQNKRDQLHAHLFGVGRLVSALVTGELDASETPMRRASVGTVIGVLIALVAAAAFWVIGLIAGGGDSGWRKPGSIIVEKETGSRYLFLDGTLRPVLNYASARLAAGGGNAEVRTVSKSSLDGVPHGLPIGIPNAPDALPDPKRLNTEPWMVCAATVGAVDGPQRPGVAVSVGAAWQFTPVPEDRAIPVATPDGAIVLVWHGQRMRIEDRALLITFGFGGFEPLPVSTAWLNALPAGPGLAPPPLPERGQPGQSLAGRSTKAGQLFEVQVAGGTGTYYLMRADGLVPISRTELALFLADPATGGAYDQGEVRAIPLTAAAAAAAPKSRTTVVTGLPKEPPRPADGADGRSVCVRLGFSAGIGATGSLVTVAADQLRVTGPRPRGDHDDDRVADQVRVPGGSGTLVIGQPAPGVENGTKFLITDVGVKFPLPGDEVAAALGYGDAKPVPVPSAVLAFLPTGNALDPQAARTQRSGPA
ncbi:type VII secretion protein EccB [Amycolatopsis sp. NPDC059027]|uniref:type VII secretion protein EccB n=1 Tax=Amycolatopsis sp. NPDC059027 TaxID=3346709 RepID=UPI00366F4FB2